MIPQIFWAALVVYATLTEAAVVGGGRRNGPRNGNAPVPTPVPRNVPRAGNAAAYSYSYSSSTSAAAASASAYYLSQAQSSQQGMNYGWTAVGCIRDSPTRTLSGMFISWDNMTLPICMNQCFGNGYTYGGVQYGRECWCGNQINTGTYTGTGDAYIKKGDTYGTITDYSECQAFPCAGDKSTYCGNNWRNNVFQVTDNAAAKSAIAASSAAAYSSASASAYSASSASTYSSLSAYSSKNAAASASTYSSSASAYSSSSLAASASAWSSASTYSSSSAAASASAYSSASRYSSSSLSASASAYSSASAYNSSTAAASASTYSSLSAYSSRSAAASASTYSSQASAYSQSSLAASASAWSSASTYSSSSLAASASAYSSASQYSSSSLAASASAYSSASAYNASSLAASASAYSSASGYSASVAAVSASAYSANSAAAYSSASTSLAAYSASSSSSAAAALATGIPSGWARTNGECVAEGTTGRALTGASTASQDMTYTKCINFCQKAGFALAGIEYSAECFCGNVLANGASLDKQSQQCTMGCSGAPSVVCGGPNAITLFIADGAAAKLSADLTNKPISLPTGWAAASSSCIAEGTTGRALTGSSTASDDMTVPKCATYCQGLNFQYAGVEFGRECYCGNDILNGASLDKTSTTCNMACAGNPSVNCGGSNGLQLYVNSAVGNSNSAAASSVAAASASAYSASVSASAAAYSASASASAAANSAALAKLPSGWKAAATTCIQEVDGRALTGASTSSNDMTIQKCASFCSSKGFTLAGLEYASECYCGNSLDNGASLDKVSTTCNMQCSGDSTFTCGGPNGIQLYTGTASPTSSAAPAASSTPAGPKLATNLPTGWSAASTNCIQEVNGRALTGASTSSNDMTIAKCIAYCSNLGFKLAGVEYAAECFCGNSLVNGAALTLPSTQCNMGCAGDSTTLCGGPNAIQLYSNPDAVAPSTSASASASSTSAAATAGPTPATNLPSDWKAADTPCILEVAGRALTGGSISVADMTIPKCLTMCEEKGFAYAGVEFGGECFCGQGLSNGASLSIASNQCNMGCTGDKTTLCGGPNAIQLYVKPKVATVNGYTLTGCIQEVVGRALNATSVYASDMTLEKCTSFCNTNGYKMAGLEYGEECFCGNSLVGGAATTLLSYECKMPCAGNSKQTCGGPDAINLYVKN